MSPLLVRALRGEPVERFPVWMMRQAGRYLPGYRRLRSRVSFLDLCRTPDLAAEVSIEPVERFGVDAAIVFADILLTADAMGAKVEFLEGGPRIESPLRSPADFERLHAPDASRTAAVARTVALLRRALPSSTAVIGFSAAPFTLAAYLVEGGTSRDHETTRRLALTHPTEFRALLSRIADALVPYLAEQAAAGADALMLFDTWGGTVDAATYRSAVVPAAARVVEGLGPRRPPVILFPGLFTESRLDDALASGADALSVDGRADLARAYRAVGGRARLQGNLDPTVLLTDPATVVAATRRMLAEVPPGASHIANLGHGILKETPPENAAAFVETVRAHVPVGVRERATG
jgi:uroporphyrinogen decarboxylase